MVIPLSDTCRAGWWLVVLAGLLFADPARAQTPSPQAPYDHPLFTGPIHTFTEPNFDQQHLRLDLTLVPDEQRLFGSATVSFVTRIPADSLLLLGHALRIDSVHVTLDSTRAAPFEQRGDSILIRLDALRLDSLHLWGETAFDVQLWYAAEPDYGLVMRPETPEAHAYVWSEGLPQSQRAWFPVYDAPGDRFTSELRITVPAPLQAFAAGRTLAVIDSSGTHRTYHYLQDQPHTTAHITLAAGVFEKSMRVATLPNGRRVLANYFVPPERADDALRSFGRAPEMLAFLSDRLGYAYPWPALTIVALPGVYPDAVVGTGLIVVDTARLLDERATLDTSTDAFLAEALARQWAGHLVAPDLQAETWLYEGLAAYLAAAFLEDAHGSEALHAALAGFARAYRDEAQRYHRPLVWNRWTHPAQLHDAHSRAKGAWVMHMLRRRLGEQAFWSGLAAFFDTYALGVAGTEAFRSVLEQVGDQPLGAFFDQWVYNAGRPVLLASYAYASANERLDLRLSQAQQGHLVPAAFDLTVDVEAHTLLGETRESVSFDQPETTARLVVPMRPRFVLIDPAQQVLMDRRLDQPATAWVAQLRYAPAPWQRRHAAEALAAFRDDPALFIGLQNALAQETHPAVRAAIIETMAALPPGDAAENVLIDLCDDEAPEVRRAVLLALQDYTDSATAIECARDRAMNDRSYTVQAAAVQALVHLQAPDAADIIESALVTPSHDEVIRRAALNAFPVLLDAPRTVVARLLPYTEAQHPVQLRTTALSLLARYPDDQRALTRLREGLRDPSYAIRAAAIHALAEAGTEDALSILRDHLGDEPHPLLRARIHHLIPPEPDGMDAP